MAKDPAFLFYSADFLIGTTFFTMEQRGKYISLLCLQHQLGHLTREQMLEVCKSEDDQIFSKFKKDDKGRYFNDRLKSESERRKAFCESRRVARMSGIEAKAKKKEKPGKDKAPIAHHPSLDEVRAYFKEKGTKIDPETFWNYYEARGWRHIKKWKSCLVTWEKRQPAPAENKKRSAFVRVLEYRVFKWEDRDIKAKLLEESYPEHEIDEAIGKKH